MLEGGASGCACMWGLRRQEDLLPKDPSGCISISPQPCSPNFQIKDETIIGQAFCENLKS